MWPGTAPSPERPPDPLPGVARWQKPPVPNRLRPPSVRSRSASRRSRAPRCLTLHLPLIFVVALGPISARPSPIHANYKHAHGGVIHRTNWFNQFILYFTDTSSTRADNYTYQKPRGPPQPESARSWIPCPCPTCSPLSSPFELRTSGNVASPDANLPFMSYPRMLKKQKKAADKANRLRKLIEAAPPPFLTTDKARFAARVESYVAALLDTGWPDVSREIRWARALAQKKVEALGDAERAERAKGVAAKRNPDLPRRRVRSSLMQGAIESSRSRRHEAFDLLREMNFEPVRTRSITRREVDLEGAPDETILEWRRALYVMLVDQKIWKGNACGPVFDDDHETAATEDLSTFVESLVGNEEKKDFLAEVRALLKKPALTEMCKLARKIVHEPLLHSRLSGAVKGAVGGGVEGAAGGEEGRRGTGGGAAVPDPRGAAEGGAQRRASERSEPPVAQRRPELRRAAEQRKWGPTKERRA